LFRHLLATVELAPGSRILDVGSNTCWASSALAAREHDVVALDIALTEMQGLHTADWWFEDRGVFERVLGSMTNIPLADESLDVVFCGEVPHHNDADELPRAMAERSRACCDPATAG
jgi:SAM-dependent methyltransferase